MINISRLCAFPAATTTCDKKEWRDYLLNQDRHIFVNGELRQIKARNLGAGVVELYTKKLKEVAQ